jgi:nickel transport system ATP-binding protein
MDEPMVHLDPPLKRELLQLVIDFFHTHHTTLIYVTHDAAEGNRITEHRITLREGVIIPDEESTYP